MRRDITIQLRVTESERDTWRTKSAASGLSLSDLIRQSMARTRTWTAKDKQLARDKVREIARIGNNLNQIAHWCNQHKDRAETVEVIAHLCAIEQMLIDAH